MNGSCSAGLGVEAVEADLDVEAGLGLGAVGFFAWAPARPARPRAANSHAATKRRCVDLIDLFFLDTVRQRLYAIPEPSPPAPLPTRERGERNCSPISLSSRVGGRGLGG